ncbi:MAG: outer membrane protein assembly factor BamD [Prevotella sp.]|nr:outer membrane protein assembly factor BamD [Prevotella sp.]
MRKLISLAFMVLVLSSCLNQFNKVYKSDNADFKYECAKEYYVKGKYTKASLLLQQLVTALKGTDNAQECLYMLAMATYKGKDYETAAQYFRKYYQSYPRGTYAEMASFYVGESLYQSSPESRLDQTPTVTAIAAYQEYLDLYPDAVMKELAHKRLFELQDKLVQKELLSAKLYYDMGEYFGNCTSGGNNYEACIVTAQNAIKDYPYSPKREDFACLIMKSKYELARSSVDEKKNERFQDAEDECYGFLNEYPDSEFKKLAQRYIEVCKKHTKKNQ